MTSELQGRLLADLQQFAVPRHARWDPLGLMGVRESLRERLSALGDLEEHHFNRAGEAGVNLILKLPGQRANASPLLVGAHYDGPLHSPGADDNASGLAALLELAQRWRAQPPRRPVWLVAFDQEEWGMVGSEALATELKASGQPLKLMVSLEMLAFTSEEQSYPHPAMRHVYGSRGDFIGLVANTSTGLMLPGLSAAMGRHVKTKVLPVPNRGAAMPDVRLSDHSPFWDQGYNALMVTDTSFMRNPHYHQMSDTVDTLDLPFFCQVVNGLDAALSRL
jgi:Zn-dependent M28 family amino/carboxypeptidase